jgi:hypothetical protein
VTARLNPDVSDFLAWQSFSAMRPKAIQGRYSEATIITGRLVFRRRHGDPPGPSARPTIGTLTSHEFLISAC